MAGRGEFERIATYFAPLATDAGAAGLKDDAAVFALTAGEEAVVTTDAMVEGTHYLRGEDPARLARKLLRVNLSDLAAKGATPRHYLLTLALPESLGEDWIAGFARGLKADQERYGIALLGGDSVRTEGPAVLSVTMLGTLPAGACLRRDGARPGHDLWVTGTVGDAVLGLAILKGRLVAAPDAATFLTGRYHLPEPPVALGPDLIGVAGAAMDVSDGLGGDVAHIARASGVAIDVALDRLPLSDAAAALIAEDIDLFLEAASGGDDYEILFTAPPEQADQVAALAARHGVAISRIGRVGEGSGVHFRGRDGDIEERLSGWRHY
ncbi:MAG: thiamine-phosphate kinase [Azospirillaceae bacterium]